MRLKKEFPAWLTGFLFLLLELLVRCRACGKLKDGALNAH
jgi:hypothetical protein